MARASATPAWQIALIVLTSTVVGTVLLVALSWARVVCIPFVLAVFFAFLLSPLVSALERHRLGRTPSVLLVVMAALLVLGGIVWVVGAQAKSVAVEVPKYTDNIKAKIASLRQVGEGTILKRLEAMVREISGEAEEPTQNARDGTAENPANAPQKPAEVVVQPETPAWLASVPALLGRLAEALGGLLMAMVLLVFMLLKREDLRNRLIRLVGSGNITATTKAFDDAGQRISRYLLMQLIVNGTFGLMLTIGLLAIGVQYALLWGFLAFLLRYVPYIGAWIAALPPILLSLAMFPGWVQPLLVIGLFVALELITSNVVEPRLYGRSIGVSEVALLVAAAFWAFLWGPIGFVLSSPLTVCLMVLGKYVPHLEFLDVLLGDRPVLAPDVVYYQRLLARDQDEATELVLTQLKKSSSEEVYDELLVPALKYAKRDRENDDLTDADEQFVLQATRETLEDLGERHEAANGAGDPVASDAQVKAKVRILACPARDETDRLALAMLTQLLDPARWDVEVTAVETLASELLAQVADQQPAVVCIGSLPPGGLAHTRYLCKRLRARFPGMKILVGRWGLQGDLDVNRQPLQEAGADLIATTLLETRRQLNSLFPVLTAAPERADGLADRADATTTTTVPAGAVELRRPTQ